MFSIWMIFFVSLSVVALEFYVHYYRTTHEMGKQLSNFPQLIRCRLSIRLFSYLIYSKWFNVFCKLFICVNSFVDVYCVHSFKSDVVYRSNYFISVSSSSVALYLLVLVDKQIRVQMLKIWISVLRAWKKLQLKYQNLRDKWTSKTPWQKWSCIYDLGKCFIELIGIKVFGDMKNYWLTASAGLLGLVYLFLTIYTVQYYIRRHNFTRAMACSYTFGLFILVSFFLSFYEWNFFLIFQKEKSITIHIIVFIFCLFLGYVCILDSSWSITI